VKARTFRLASAAAALFVAGASGQALAESAAGSEAKIKCEGVNACKGQGSCKTAKNSCSGMNACKGQSYLMLTPEECAAAKAKLEKQE
jgi:hypothetical protein